MVFAAAPDGNFGASGAESILKVADTHWPSSSSQFLTPPGQLDHSPTDSTPSAKGGLQSVVKVSPTCEYWQRQALPPSPGIGNFALHARILHAWHMDSMSLTSGSIGVCSLHGFVGPHFTSGTFASGFSTSGTFPSGTFASGTFGFFTSGTSASGTFGFFTSGTSAFGTFGFFTSGTSAFGTFGFFTSGTSALGTFASGTFASGTF